MYIIYFSFSGSEKEPIGYAHNYDEVFDFFQKLKKTLEHKHNNLFDIAQRDDTYILSGNEHDGYRLTYTATPIKHINEGGK